MASKTRSANTNRVPELGDQFWRTAKRAARRIPFMEEVVASYYCALDDKTPLRAKGILLGIILSWRRMW